MRAELGLLLVLATFPPQPVAACKCVGTGSVCDRFASADVVFIGEVDSRRPDFDPYDPAWFERIERLFPDGNLDDAAH